MLCSCFWGTKLLHLKKIAHRQATHFKPINLLIKVKSLPGRLKLAYHCHFQILIIMPNANYKMALQCFFLHAINISKAKLIIAGILFKFFSIQIKAFVQYSMHWPFPLVHFVLDNFLCTNMFLIKDNSKVASIFSFYSKKIHFILMLNCNFIIKLVILLCSWHEQKFNTLSLKLTFLWYGWTKSIMGRMNYDPAQVLNND